MRARANMDITVPPSLSVVKSAGVFPHVPSSAEGIAALEEGTEQDLRSSYCCVLKGPAGGPRDRKANVFHFYWTLPEGTDAPRFRPIPDDLLRYFHKDFEKSAAYRLAKKKPYASASSQRVSERFDPRFIRWKKQASQTSSEPDRRPKSAVRPKQAANRRPKSAVHPDHLKQAETLLGDPDPASDVRSFVTNVCQVPAVSRDAMIETSHFSGLGFFKQRFDGPIDVASVSVEADRSGLISECIATMERTLAKLKTAVADPPGDVPSG